MDIPFSKYCRWIRPRISKNDSLIFSPENAWIEIENSDLKFDKKPDLNSYIMNAVSKHGWQQIDQGSFLHQEQNMYTSKGE